MSPDDLAYLRSLAPLPLKGRKLTVLIDVSNKCNIRCRMCYFHFDSVFYRAPVFTDLPQLEHWAKELLPHAHTLHLACGSESMTSPHFPSILKLTAEFGVANVKFLTNALLMDAEVRDAIVESNVSEIHVSIDGATRETYNSIRIGGDLDVLRKNVKALTERKRVAGRGIHDKPVIQFNLTLMRANLHELPLFVDLAEELGATRIAARHLMPYEGLNLEDETLEGAKHVANTAFADFLSRVESSPTVVVSDFPDPFEVHEAECPTDPDQETEHEWVKASNLHKPFGSLDLPAASHASGIDAIQLEGWALSDDGVDSVLIGREPLGQDDRADCDEFGLIPLGRARVQIGLRSDVAERYRQTPDGSKCAWSFIINRAQLPGQGAMSITVHAIAVGQNGRATALGSRSLLFDEYISAKAISPSETVHTPFLYCHRPFDGVYVDSAGNVYPYPDCQTVEPFGRLEAGDSFEEIWYGEAFMELRRRIVNNDPPPMCITCPDFINRSVDDSEFFKPRSVENDFRLPIGHLDIPNSVKIETLNDSVLFSGWALGFEEFEGVTILCAPNPKQPTEEAHELDWISIGTATFHEGTRPDVAKKHRRRFRPTRGGWTFTLRREDLPPGDSHQIFISAQNMDGSSTKLGQRTLLWRSE